MVTVNELFSGIGAQVAALKRLGIDYETVGISEIDRFAIQSYEAINGKTRNYGDISKVERLDYADLWTYSFPCTDISLAGKQAGLVDETGNQTRSGLLFEVERLLKKSVEDGTQPKYLLLENVKNLVGKKFKPEFDKWLQTLDSLGYNTYWQVLNSKDYGVPQNRERVFAVSIRKDIDDGEFKFPEKTPLDRRLKDVLETNVDKKYYLKQELVETFIERLAKREVSNTIRCGGAGSIDQKHTWDLVAESAIIQNPHGFNNGGLKNVAPTLTSSGGFERNNFIVQPNNTCADDTAPNRGVLEIGIGHNPISKKFEFDGFHENRPRPTLLATDYKCPKCYSDGVRIRKLTPKECWRLMDFIDEEFEAAEKAGVSNTQLYKQAGNSIVVSVLAAIFKNMFQKGETK